MSAVTPSYQVYTHEMIVCQPGSPYGPVGVIVCIFSVAKTLDRATLATTKNQGLIPFTYGMVLDPGLYPELHQVTAGTGSICWMPQALTAAMVSSAGMNRGDGDFKLPDMRNMFPRKVQPKCECGKEKHGFARHSDWCDMAKTEAR